MSQIIGPEGLLSGGITTKWAARVFAADAYSGPWSWVPYLTVKSFSMVSAPEIAKATFVFDYGFIKQNDLNYIDTYLPQDLGNKFIRIELQNSYGSFIAWQGWMTDNNLDVWAEAAAPQGEGVQIMQAYGLEYLLTKVKIKQALARVQLGGPPAEAHWLDWVPPFNMAMARGTLNNNSGNRSKIRFSVDLGDGNIQDIFIFNQTNQPEWGLPWSAADAVETALKVYGTPLGIPWGVNGQLELIENYEPRHSIGEMSLWDALYSLMPRQRGMAFTMEHIDPPTLWLSSEFIDDIVVATDSGAIIFPGNPEVYDIDFNDYLDMKRSTVFMTTQDRYREVIVTGEKIRCTFSPSVQGNVNPNGELVNGWTVTDEDFYRNPPVLPTPPVGADAKWYRSARDRFRSQEILSRVFKYWTRRKTWDGFISSISCCPVATDDGGIDQTQAALPAVANQGFMRTLPFLAGIDYSVDPPERVGHLGVWNEADHRRAFGVISDIDGDWNIPVWFYLHELQSGKVPNIIMRMADTEYGIELPNAGHFLAANVWQWDPDANPDVSNYYPVYSYEDLNFTVQWQLDQRLKVKEVISGNPNDAVLHLHVPGAHCWCVHPNTIVDVADDGGLLTYAGPYEFRNDKDILRKVAAVAKGWYSTRRNLARYTITGMFPHIPVGAMLGVGYTGGAFAQINTVVSKKIYTFDEEPTCQVFTGYANLDIVGAAMTTIAGPAGGARSSGAGNRSAAAKGKMPTTPSNAVLIRQTHAQLERVEREEDRTEQLPVTIPAGMGGGGSGSGPHVHSGESGDNEKLSLQRTQMEDDTDTTQSGTIGVHLNAGKWYSDRALIS